MGHKFLCKSIPYSSFHPGWTLWFRVKWLKKNIWNVVIRLLGEFIRCLKSKMSATPNNGLKPEMEIHWSSLKQSEIVPRIRRNLRAGSEVPKNKSEPLPSLPSLFSLFLCTFFALGMSLFCQVLLLLKCSEVPPQSCSGFNHTEEISIRLSGSWFKFYGIRVLLLNHPNIAQSLGKSNL